MPPQGDTVTKDYVPMDFVDVMLSLLDCISFGIIVGSSKVSNSLWEKTWIDNTCIGFWGEVLLIAELPTTKYTVDI